MKKHKLVLNLPSAEELLVGLSLDEVHPALPEAKAKLLAAKDNLEELRLAFDERRDAVEVQLPAAIREGRATSDELVAAIAQQRSLAVKLTGAEHAVKLATRAADQEKDAAMRVLGDAVAARGEQLSAIVAELSPVLGELRKLDHALGERHPWAREQTHRGVGLNWPIAVGRDSYWAEP